MRYQFSRTALTVATSFFLLIGVSPAVHANTASISTQHSASVSSSASEAAPDTLPYKSLDEVKAEALSKGLDAESTELAVELQKIINAYYELPENLKALPYESPIVQRALPIPSETVKHPNSLARLASPSINYGAAWGCAKAVASTLLKRGTPIGQFWTLIEVMGGVVEFAKGMESLIRGNAQEGFKDYITREIGPEMGFLVGRIFGYTDIVLSCKDVNK